MSYEQGDYINQLIPENPAGTDSISEGDIHLRLIKKVLKKSFPTVNEEVNVIHAGAEPTIKEPGTVWYDASGTGLVKLWDGSDWLNMAHGGSSGLGSQLKVSYDRWYTSHTFDDQSQVLLKDFTVTPLSEVSTFMIELSGLTTGGGTFQLKDDTNGVDITPEMSIDSGSMFMREFYAGHGGNMYEVGLWGRGTSSTRSVLFVATELE
jgi:hypothetical protein